jgi:hypothetical protein
MFSRAENWYSIEILEDDADALGAGLLSANAQVSAVEEYRPFGRPFVETSQQFDECRLTRPLGPTSATDCPFGMVNVTSERAHPSWPG